MDKPLLECSSEMSTCLGSSTSPSAGGVGRHSIIAHDNPTSINSDKRERKENWNSWTGVKGVRDSRHLSKGDRGSEKQLSKSPSQKSIQHPITLYTRNESGGTEIEEINLPTSHRSSMSSTGNSEGNIIEGELTTNDFEQVGASLRYGWNEPSTTRSLDFCKKHNLRHYNRLLKVIGWRKFRNDWDHVPWYLGIFNFFYPFFMFLMLVFACVAQMTACFGRDTSLPPEPIRNTNYTLLSCEHHIVTSQSLSYLFILIAYIGGFFIFRWTDSEHLSALAETVFLSFNYASINRSRKQPAILLMGIFICGFVWLVFSFGVSVLRLFSLKLHSNNTIIEWFYHNTTDQNTSSEITTVKHYEVLHYFFVSSAMLGFVFFDLLYIAVTINFCCQCQLLKYYVENLIDKVQNKRYTSLNSACKEIYRVYEFLQVLNGKVSLLMSFIALAYLSNLVNSYQNLRRTSYADKENIALGFLNLIQWLSITLFPVIIAMQFTNAGNALRRLGMQIASRPFIYEGTPDLELQYFLNFSEATRFSAKIAFVPMYPSLVMGSGFVLILLVAVGIVIPRVQSVPWF